MDFEQAAINAFHAVFPNSTLKGCFYHLSQNIYRKVQAGGLQERYASDEGISQMTRMLAALAFVPTNRVVDTFELLQQQVPPELEPIADYVENNYIGRPQRRGRRPPRFPIDFWNIHDRIAGGLPRTNNSVEGFHRHIQASILCCHPNIWTFLKVLQKEQALNEIQITQMMAGQQAPPQRRQYRESGQRILRIVRGAATGGVWGGGVYTPPIFLGQSVIFYFTR